MLQGSKIHFKPILTTITFVAVVPLAGAQNIDAGNAIVGKSYSWNANFKLSALHVSGCSSSCQIDSYSVSTFGPADLPSPQTSLRAGQKRPFSDVVPIGGSVAPRNVGDFGYRIHIAGGCSIHAHPHKSMDATITWHGTAPKVQMKVLSAVMRDNYTFDVHLDRHFQGSSYPVRVRYVVNGKSVDISNSYGDTGARSGPNGMYTSDPLSFGFLNSVPKFQSDQNILIDAMVKVRDWEYHTAFQAYIPLPTVVVPGAQPLSFVNPFLNLYGGNGAFSGIETATFDSISKRNNYVSDPAAMQFGDEQLVRLPGQATVTRPFYPLLQTVDFHNSGLSRNLCSLAHGGQLVLKTVNAILNNTWASKVNLVSHSKGCLLARYAFFQGQSLGTSINNMVMIEGPHAGMPEPFELDVLSSVIYGTTFDNLLPTVYNSYKDVGQVKYKPWPIANDELALLNRTSMPHGPYYVMYYSDAYSNTLWAVDANPGKKDIFGAGDERVPVFSQQGQSIDANNLKAGATTLYAFRGNTLHYMRVPGTKAQVAHGATMTNNAFINSLVKLLYP